MIKVLIIDDEEYAREIINEFLEKHENIYIAGNFSDGFSALKAIYELRPDLIFLDIQMPKLTGFEMLELIEDPPLIVFTTAFDEFAIKAFEQNAIDYLLKPVTPE
ncbi:MAG: response regulator, partial [Bacteroidales bacterium]|nr:response regulator [Bacteroidales bacterium]